MVSVDDVEYDWLAPVSDSVPGPALTRTNPPMAGPSARATFITTPLAVTAERRDSLGTISGVTECQPGELRAAPTDR